MGSFESLSDANRRKDFQRCTARLDGMKPNISTYTVLFKLGFTGNWDISHGIEHLQRSEMIEFLIGAVQPNLRGVM